MGRIVLDHKTILAHNLTCSQATNLMEEIRNRPELKKLFANKEIWVSNSKPRYEGDKNIYYVYTTDEVLRKAFLKEPESFIFEFLDKGQT